MMELQEKMKQALQIPDINLPLNELYKEISKECTKIALQEMIRLFKQTISNPIYRLPDGEGWEGYMDWKAKLKELEQQLKSLNETDKSNS